MSGPAALRPLETLYAAADGASVPLPATLRALYGTLALPRHRARPHVVANFVSTLDGVVDLGAPGKQGGGAISGFNRHDRLVMGILRAASDAVVVGAGTLRSVPRHLWTAEHIFPDLAGDYRALRARLGKDDRPVNVVVTARGELDAGLPVFRSGEVPVLVVTNRDGARRLRTTAMPSWVDIAVAAGKGPIGAGALLAAVDGRIRPRGLVLVEGGPTLMGRFLAEGRLDELFLTLSPQVAGRDGQGARPGFAAGALLAPDRPVWGRLADARRGGDHLFLRYGFRAARRAGGGGARGQSRASNM